MSKVKYKYNPRTLTYERVEHSLKQKFMYFLSFAGATSVVTAFGVLLGIVFFETAGEKKQKEDNQFLVESLDKLEKKLEKEGLRVLEDIENRDNNVFRVIFEAEPIPFRERNAGIGGSNRFEEFEGNSNSERVIEMAKRIEQFSMRLYKQSKSFDQVENLARSKEVMMAALPAIQPVANKDLKRMASGYGYRIHPIYKTRKMHWGMDFTAPTGTDIHTTGDGKVVKATYANGYGNHVMVDHGFGYKTLYAHMSKITVKKGQKVKRGEAVGLVGNTGLSTAPHLHYEVFKNGKKVNPVNYYFNDLSPAEYGRIIEMASKDGQSFD